MNVSQLHQLLSKHFNHQTSKLMKNMLRIMTKSNRTNLNLRLNPYLPWMILLFQEEAMAREKLQISKIS